jgi:hypothetical protein
MRLQEAESIGLWFYTVLSNRENLNTGQINPPADRFTLSEAAQTCARESFRGATISSKAGMHKNLGDCGRRTLRLRATPDLRSPRLVTGSAIVDDMMRVPCLHAGLGPHKRLPMQCERHPCDIQHLSYLPVPASDSSTVKSSPGREGITRGLLHAKWPLSSIRRPVLLSGVSDKF